MPLHKRYSGISIIVLIALVGPTGMVRCVVAVVFGLCSRVFDGGWDCVILLL